MGLRVDENGIQFTTNKSVSDRRKKFYRQIVWTVSTASLMLVVVVYLVLGFTVDSGWSHWWPILFTGLVPGPIVECVLLKDPNRFPIWGLCLLAYFLCAATAGLGYHPYWVILLLIPIYYGVVNSLTKLMKAKKALEEAEKEDNAFAEEQDCDE